MTPTLGTAKATPVLRSVARKAITCVVGCGLEEGTPVERHHPRLVAGAVIVILAVGVVYAVLGHPVAIGWSAGVAAVVLAPQIFQWLARPRRPRTWRHTAWSPWRYAAVILAGLAMVSGFVLEWYTNGTDRSGHHLRGSVEGFVLGSLIILSGVTLAGLGVCQWYLDRRRVRTERRTRRSAPVS